MKGLVAMRVALWGFGGYGKYLLNLLRTVWADRYEVVAVFDRALEAKVREVGDEIALYHPDEMRTRFEAGEFAGVFIATQGIVGRYNDMADQARNWGIPVLNVVSEESLAPANSIDLVTENSLSCIDDGYILTTCCGVYAFVEQGGSQKLFIYHDGVGHVVRDTWFRDDVKWDPLALNLSQRIDAVPRVCHELVGDYCATNRFWATNYWHFTFEILDQIGAMETAGFTGTYVLLKSDFAPELLDLLGIGPERILWVDDLDTSAAYRFERLRFIRLFDYLFHGNRMAVPLLRCARIIEKKIDAERDYTEYPKRLFVKRIGTRRLVGADQVLSDYGFTTIVPEELSVREQIAHFRAADIVITPHGANSTNCLYMRPGSVFIEIFGQQWGCPLCVNPLFKKGIHYLSVTGGFELAGAPKDDTADFSVDDTFLKMAIRNALCLTERSRSCE